MQKLTLTWIMYKYYSLLIMIPNELNVQFTPQIFYSVITTTLFQTWILFKYISLYTHTMKITGV